MILSFFMTLTRNRLAGPDTEWFINKNAQLLVSYVLRCKECTNLTKDTIFEFAIVKPGYTFTHSGLNLRLHPFMKVVGYTSALFTQKI